MANKPQHMTTIEAILANGSGIAQDYRHVPKRVTPGESIETNGAVLKWYALHQVDGPAPNETDRLARSHLARVSLEAKGLGFVILHRCGNDFYFLIVSTWRGNNEVWETVFYKMARRCLTLRSGRATECISRPIACGNSLRSGTRKNRGSAF